LLPLALCACGFVTAACTLLTEPRLPHGSIPMDPARPYAMWWRMTEACAGVTGRFEDVRWYYVPGPDVIVLGREYDGFWMGSRDAIILAEEDRMSPSLVRHEMLHALTGAGHSREYFGDKCAGVVSCGGSCLAEAGESVPSDDALEIEPAELDVSLRVDPLLPRLSLAADSGWIAMTVTVRNPRPVGVWAVLTRMMDNEWVAKTYGFSIRCVRSCQGGTGSSYHYIYEERFGVRASDVRRHVFDFRLDPGRYAIRGEFNERLTDEVVLTIVQ
jgi:hypothetical protein